MRILIFSDTHGMINSCIQIIDRIQKVDMILHAGDYTRDAEDLEALYPNIPLHYIKGNNDLFSNAPTDRIIPAAGTRIFLTHGHTHRVKSDREFETLIQRGKEKKADLVVFGHTHMPYEAKFGTMTVLNPGTAGYSGTYAIAEIENGILKTAICKE